MKFVLNVAFDERLLLEPFVFSRIEDGSHCFHSIVDAAMKKRSYAKREMAGY
ncbi:hypothetical protein [Paraburkholderia sp. J12]|uniref:hypothetical protein n=1 Tax=Paraburkholderia sp. J12 TaxID=2805432 RepID=UPI002ABDF4F6|nr:hypothetical protein [Paraburkholderia sp. J12]